MFLDAHTWTKSCQPIIQPNNGFWEQLMHYEFQLFGKNTLHMVNSPRGEIQGGPFNDSTMSQGSEVQLCH